MDYPIQDLIIGILLVVGLFMGLMQGFFRKLNRVIILAIVFSLIYFIFSPMLSNWIRYNAFADFNYVLTLELQGMTFKIYSVEDLFVVFQNVGIDPDLLKLNCEGLCNALSFIILFLASFSLSTFLSWIFYHLIFKRLLPKKIRKPKVVGRLFGGLLGAMEWGFVIFIFASAIGSLTGGLESVVIPQLSDTNSSIYELFKNFGIDTSVIETIKTPLEIIVKNLNPENSSILKVFFDFDSNAFNGFDLFNGAKIVNKDGKEEIVKSTLFEGMTTIWSELTTKVQF